MAVAVKSKRWLISLEGMGGKEYVCYSLGVPRRVNGVKVITAKEIGYVDMKNKLHIRPGFEAKSVGYPNY